ncbi:MAG: hypothetical protein P1Q69_16400, partial [Candidatus Thorarchaeota archaeon]|nr:hypothetical protein [Candidatus Thorarchaeota archaeon]
VMGLLMLFAFLIPETESHFTNQIHRALLAGIIFSITPILHGIVLIYIFPALGSLELMMSCLILASLGIAAFILTPFLASRQEREGLSIDVGYLMTTCLLMAIASLYTLFAVTTASDYWIYGENIQIAAFFVFGLTTGVPCLRRYGLRRRTSYTVIIGLAISTYIPLLATTILESLNLGSGTKVTNMLGYAIIHTGTIALAIMMILLLFAFSRLKPSTTQYPLTMLFAVWAGVGVTSVLIFIIPGAIYTGENVVAYLAGGILTFWLLIKLDLSVRNEPAEINQISTIHLFRNASLYFMAVIVAETVNLFVISALNLSPNLLGNGLLLVCNFLVMLGFVYVVFRLSSVAEGTISFELYVICFLALWIMPSTLKSFYSVWTFGWWLSEILLFIALLIGPAILSLLYIQAVREINESHTRARLYADILMHDITNYNQMTLTTLELLASEKVQAVDLDRMVSDAKHAVSLAEQLISNVRLLSESEDWKNLPTVSMNLVSEIVSALDEITHSPRNPDRVFRFASDISHAHVVGNELLGEAVLNILYVALEIPSKRHEFEISILPLSNFGENWWGLRIDISDIYSNSKEHQELIGKTILFNIQRSLGFQVARLIIEGMNGHLEIETEINERGRSVNFVASLPGAKSVKKID